MSEDVTRQILEQDNARLQKELDDLRALLARPVGVTVQSPDSGALHTISQYMPQLTQMSNNMSYVASNLLLVNTTLQAIAKSLEAGKRRSGPNPIGTTIPGQTQKLCNCDGPPHNWTEGWCP